MSIKYYESTVKCDSNGGDYIYEVSKINLDQYESVKKAFDDIGEALKKHGGRYGVAGHDDDVADEKLFDLLISEKVFEDEEVCENFIEGYFPSGQFGFHTIKEIKISPFGDTEIIFEMEYKY